MEQLTQRDTIQEIKDRVFERDVEAILILNVENSSSITTRYLSGFTGSFSALIITPRRNIILTDSRYWTQAKEESTFELVKYVPPKTFLDTVVDILSNLDVRKIGLEKDKISLSTYETLTSRLSCSVEDVSQILSDVRARKSKEEVEKIKIAVRIAEEAFKKMLEIVQEGMSERELAAYLEYQMKILGAEDVAFETIVASGPRGALPHGRATERRIGRGEPVVVDWGARYGGYNSDITRVFSVGEPSDKVKRVHEIVLAAQSRALEKLKAGVTGREVDEVARKLIVDEGYGEYFGHGLGHGLGLAVHEEPSLSYRNDKPLAPGNVVTVEPGVYLEGEFGIRVEEDVLVTDNGCEVLTTLDRSLIVL